MVLTSSASSSQTPAGSIDIRVLGIGTFSHPIQRTTSVADIKRVVNEKYHIHPANQQVPYEGQNLADDFIVANLEGPELLIQVEDDFPHALPRFSVVPLNNIHGTDLKMEKTKTGLSATTLPNRREDLKTIVKRKNTKNIMFQLSPMSPITLNAKIREGLKIQEGATHFSWAYPPAGKEIQLKPDEENNEELRNLASFFSVGGFVYFDEDLSHGSISFTGLVPDQRHGALSFGAPQQWKHELTRCLAGRFHPVTIEDMNKLGAARYCWVEPQETFHGAIPENQHGMFVYLFHEPSSGTEKQKAMSRYFCVQDDIEDADEDEEEEEEEASSSAAARVFPTARRSSNFEQSTNGVISEAQQPPTVPDSERQLEQQREDENRCAICLTGDKSHAFVPCGHLAICRECATTLQQGQPHLRKCVICRAFFQNIVHVYAS